MYDDDAAQRETTTGNETQPMAEQSASDASTAARTDGLRANERQRADFDRLVVIPLGTSEEANIGAMARAMANFGFHRLTVAEPRCEDPKSGRARALAAGAEDTLQGARVVRSLDEALELDGVQLLAGATARRSRSRGPFLTPLEWAVDAWRAMRAGATVGLLMGREDTGLANEEIDRCHWKISIPTCGSLHSLNLAQATLLILHTLQEVSFGRMGTDAGEQLSTDGASVDSNNESTVPGPRGHHLAIGDRVFAAEERTFRIHSHPDKTKAARRLANVVEQERLAGEFQALLEAIDYCWPENRPKIMRPFRLLMGRARPTSREVGILTTFVRRTMMTLEHGGNRNDAAARAATPDRDAPAADDPDDN